jgi:hypothetical protein
MPEVAGPTDDLNAKESPDRRQGRMNLAALG